MDYLLLLSGSNLFFNLPLWQKVFFWWVALLIRVAAWYEKGLWLQYPLKHHKNHILSNQNVEKNILVVYFNNLTPPAQSRLFWGLVPPYTSLGNKCPPSHPFLFPGFSVLSFFYPSSTFHHYLSSLSTFSLPCLFCFVSVTLSLFVNFTFNRSHTSNLITECYMQFYQYIQIRKPAEREKWLSRNILERVSWRVNAHFNTASYKQCTIKLMHFPNVSFSYRCCTILIILNLTVFFFMYAFLFTFRLFKRNICSLVIEYSGMLLLPQN